MSNGNRMRQLFLVLVIFLGTVGCASFGGTNLSLIDQIRSSPVDQPLSSDWKTGTTIFKKASPAVEAKKSCGGGQPVYLKVCTYSCVVVGLSIDEMRLIESEHSAVLKVPGTSDTPPVGAVPYIEASTEFAEKFNREVFRCTRGQR